jgi:hypothetical protein
MWMLKMAEGGKYPYIFSTNNFVGRQIWEFDPQVAPHNFYKNRFHVKPTLQKNGCLVMVSIVSV